MTRLSEMEFTEVLRRNPDLRRGLEGQPAKSAAVKAPTEEEEQISIMRWAEANEGRLPALRLLFHVPNGGAREWNTAKLLKAAGVKAGVPDLVLPVARGGHHALWVELKRADHSNCATPMQKAWMDALRSEGHRCVVAYGAGEAIETIEEYLSL